MLCLIIILLVLLEQTAQRHCTRDKQKVGRNDDHDHGDKEQKQRCQRIVNRHRQVIGP